MTLKRGKMKIKSGTFIRVWYSDAMPEIVMLIENASINKRKPRSLKVLTKEGDVHNHIQSNQLIEVMKKVDWPSCKV